MAKIKSPSIPVLASFLTASLAATTFAAFNFRSTDWLSQTVSVEVSRASLWISASVSIILIWILVWLTWFRKAIGTRKSKGRALIKNMTADTRPFFQELDGSVSDIEDDVYVPRPKHLILARSEIKAVPSSVEEFWFPQREKHRPATDIPTSFLYVASSKFVSGLSEEEFLALYDKLEWLSLNEGEVLFREGDEAKGMYIVIEGSVGVFKNTDTGEYKLSDHFPGDSFGEIGVILQEKRFSTVKAVENTRLIFVSHELFAEITEKRPELIVSFIKITLSPLWRVANFVLQTYLGLPVSRSCPTSRYDVPELHGFLQQPADETKEAAPTLINTVPGQALFREDDIEQKLYIVLEGQLELESEGESPCSFVYPAGSILGGVGFLTGTAYNQTIRSKTRCSLYCFTWQTFLAHPQAHEIALAIARVMFKTIRQFIELGFERDFKRSGTYIFKKGDPADSLFITVSGRVRLLDHDPDHSFIEIGMGECAGEVTFLAGSEEHSHSALCVRDSYVVRLSLSSFLLLQNQYPQVLRKLTLDMAKRFEWSLKHEKNSSQIHSIALIPISPNLDLVDFAQNLCNKLGQIGRTKYINMNIIDQQVASDASRQVSFSSRALLSSWVCEQGEKNRFVLLEGNGTGDSWDKFVLRNADQIVLVGNAAESHEISDVERQLVWSEQNKSLAPIILLLTHSPETILPRNTRAWLNDRPVSMHFHVRVDKMEHFSRLSRYFAQKSVGLVLSGGGARGLAHLGVIKSVLESGFSIDFIGGTSQGSLVASAFAMTENSQGMLAKLEPITTRMGSIWELVSDATFPVLSYFSGKGMNQMLQSMLLPELSIEDFWIPFFCVSTNITRADIKIHSSGAAWSAVRASMSILEYLPPLHDGKDVLIDGGYINNLPVDVMKELWNPRFVIASDVENKDKLNYDYFGEHMNGWWLIWQKTIASTPCGGNLNLPRFSDLIGALSYINHNRNIRQMVQKKLIDVYIRPDLGETRLLDYHKFLQLAELGYRYARARLLEYRMKNPNTSTKLRRTRSFTFKSSMPAKEMQLLFLASPRPLIRPPDAKSDLGVAAPLSPSKSDTVDTPRV